MNECLNECVKEETNELVASRLLQSLLSIEMSLFCFCLDSLSASVILGSLDNKYYYQLMSYLVPVLRSSTRSKFVRCWHAKTDGWAASTFHRQCDNKGPTVTIIKVNNYIFGGYTDVSWSGKYHIITVPNYNTNFTHFTVWYFMAVRARIYPSYCIILL